MFEKSLVDLIRGLRGHKGNEAEYIQNALKECRTEIRSQDMDVKATALLKLIYLEMFGHDMTWAAFNVLEVMSSAKHLQKRVGYLAAVQSFRPDTEVLMLATNLLKKDLTSPAIPVLSLPLITLPHIITSSLALSILTDLLPRLSHSQPAVRKKTIVTLYRLALVYPETLRVAWPKIKERLLDEDENSSVTAATVNVVCELGWRRPQDFLPLAPRLFDLLIEGRNNWMAIKIIKLFAVLTPLEPRLVKKLVRPLTNLVQSTSAMSLLYECISGIIQGGILDGGDTGAEVDEVADICITKLRGMIVLEGDPNLKYVALLAFNKIVASHPMLVSLQQDVILNCLDDPDVSIRMQALELVSGMVSTENLQPIIDRLVKQLSRAPRSSSDKSPGKRVPQAIEMTAEPEGDDLERKLVPDKRGSETQELPDEYRREVIMRILDMASKNNYANLTDFEWYVDILVTLVALLPLGPAATIATSLELNKPHMHDLATRIGDQLLDIAVRVKEIRAETTQAAERLVLISNRDSLFSIAHTGLDEILRQAGWIVGEYAAHLSNPHEVLNSLIHETAFSLSNETLARIVQAIPKILARLAHEMSLEWNVSRKTMLSLLLARTTDFMDRLAIHPGLEVQERSVEILELFRLVSEALSSQAQTSMEAPMLVTSVLPSLFTGLDINPVAGGAQRKVPLPEDANLDQPINPDLAIILQSSQALDTEDGATLDFEAFYQEGESEPVTVGPKIKVLEPEDEEIASYQTAEDPEVRARRKAERRAKSTDDPFYIAPELDSSGRSTPFHEIISKSNGDQLDIDSIRVVDLQLDTEHSNTALAVAEFQKQQKKRKTVKKYSIAADETIEDTDTQSRDSPVSHSLEAGNGFAFDKPARRKQNLLLSVDSSNLRQFALEGEGGEQLDIEKREAEEAEMAAAIREVQRLRLEMQREAERTHLAEGVDAEGTVVKKKKRRKPKALSGDAAGPAETKQKPVEGVIKKKKKKKREKVGINEAPEAE